MLTDTATDTRLHPWEAFKAVRRLLGNPGDTREVFVVLRAMRGRSVIKSFRRFAASATGAAVLGEHRSLLPILQDHEALARMPSESLGRTYLEFMQEENLSAEGLAQISEGAENTVWPDDFSLYRRRMRDMHDLTHVLTGYGRDPLGEICLLAFMFAHSRNPGVGLIVGMGLLRMPAIARRAVFQAWRNGGRAEWLPGLDWESMLARSLETLRIEAGIIEPSRYLALRP